MLAVRGPFSARGLKGDFILADAGLLADELVPLPEKEYDLGIVAHWTDKELIHNKTFLKYDPKIIDVSGDPLQVISDIGKCKKIVTSSLHGAIVADTFNIPRRIEIAPRFLTHAHQEGGLFKWFDYHASLNERFEVGVTKEVDYNKILEKQYELFDVFQQLRRIFNRDNL